MPLMRHGWRMSAAGLGFAGLIALGVRGMAVVALPTALPPWSESADSRGVMFADAHAVAPVSVQPASPVTSRLAERQREVPLLHRAFVAFDRTLAGGTPGDEQSLGAQATGAQGPDIAQLRRAEQDVASARAALQFAQVEQTRVSEVPNASERQAAERELAAARATVLRAEADVARLSGPDPVVLDAAERKVQRAEATLLAAMAPHSMLAAPNDRLSTAGMHDNPAVQSARLALQEAVSRRDFVRAGPPAWELERAQAALMAARLSVEVAAQRLDATGQADAMQSAEDARVAVLAARSVLNEAEARLRALQAATP